ncbi:ATP-binding protein [Zavarzinia compransoris]|nr:ATP-binding protein [Zavarzinia compransoris]TDP48669.1 two-component system sensor histidine kinase UhpB [Zavarzinia compransoris]
MSIRLRIVAVFGAFALAAVLVVLGLMVANARQAVREEMAASLDLVAALVEPALSSPRDGAALAGAFRSINERARHIDIILDGALAARHAPPEAEVPPWFVALVGVGPIERRLAMADDRTLILRADPADEVAEVWADVATLGLAGLVLLPLCLVGFSLAVSRATRPVSRLVEELGALAAGDFDRPAPDCTVAELAPLCEGIERLRRALHDKTVENLDLAAVLVRAQDEERQALARDIHDHIGPLLFGLKIDLAGAPAETLALVEDMQLWHRQIIDRLHPPSFDHVPLSRILADRIARWRRLKPEVGFTFESAPGLDELDGVAARTLYLVIQEGIMNALRHGGAGQIAVRLEFSPGLVVAIDDDGRGIRPDDAPGVGLAAMRHRLRALGGGLAVGPLAAGGTRLTARLPVSRKKDSDDDARAAG